MTRILHDLILCSKTDPVLRVPLPANLMAWVKEAAAYRETTVEIMVRDMLYDRFHRVLDEDGELRELNNLERRLRRLSQWRVLDTKKRMRKKELVTEGPLSKAAIAANKQSAWTEYTKIREANIKILEQEEFELHRRKPTKMRSSAELEELSARLDARGIKATKILVDGKQVLLRPDSYRSGAGRNVGIYDEKTGLVAGSTRDFDEARAVYEEVRAKYEALDE